MTTWAYIIGTLYGSGGSPAYTIGGNVELVITTSGNLQGASGSSPTDGLEITGTDNFVTVDGSIYGFSGIHSSITGSGFNTITIGGEGLVVGFAVAILLDGGGGSVTNAGQISSGSDGIVLIGDQNSVVNSGLIEGFIGVDMAGASSAIQNSGTIEGATGIFFELGAGAGIDLIDNSGTIEASYAGRGNTAAGFGVKVTNGDNLVLQNKGFISANTGVVYDGATLTTDTLTNTGTLDGRSAYAVQEAGAATLQIVNGGAISGHGTAIAFAAATGNSLDNSGTIQGDITVASGGTLDVVNSGHIAGQLTLGDGNDSYDGSLGSISKYVLGGAGDDDLAGGSGRDHLDGGTGNDTIDGGAGNDVMLAEGTTATIDGHDGNDVIDMASYFNAADQIDGGSGRDTLKLNGNYSTGIVLGADTLTNVEKIILATGFSYNFTTDDNNVAAGGRLVVDASTLATGQILTFNGSAETDGRFAITGGAGADVLTGGAGNDVFVGNLGKNVFDGGAGADRMTGGGNIDTFVYLDTSDSTSTVRDIVTSFNTVNDKFDLDVTVANIDTAVVTGRLGAANFDTNLTAALAGHLAAGDAIVFTPTLGGLQGHTFLIVDANGVAGYQAGQDYVIELVGTGSLSGLSTANFI